MTPLQHDRIVTLCAECFLGTDTDLTCVHMTTLNCLVRNATSYIIHGNSLSLETWGGFHVRRSSFGGELYRLSQKDAERIIRLPFAKPDTATALTPAQPPAPAVVEPTPETTAELDKLAQKFTVNKKGQADFGF